jgi:hypothetical protein
MAFPQIRIGLLVAQHIFEGVEFLPIEAGGKTVAYRAIFKGHVYEDAAIVHLCKKLWNGNA